MNEVFLILFVIFSFVRTSTLHNVNKEILLLLTFKAKFVYILNVMPLFVNVHEVIIV